ncbi:MAG TPA: RDD family protein [Nitrospirales bacterium]|nr:RDD family protein [Nitrospirales bacterium]
MSSEMPFALAPEHPQVEYVGFWKRALASVIDSALALIVTVPLLLSVYGLEYFDPGRPIKGPVDLLISWVLPAVAVLLFWSYKQATPGKMAVHAKIANAATGGVPTDLQLLGRYLGYFISGIPLGLGFLWVAFDRRKQAWHDKLAGTVVISTP